MAKKVKVKDVDVISDLPESILSHILSFLSTKEAVQTSVLSTRWRNLFTLVSSLDFELDDEYFRYGRKGLKSSTIKSFMCFVDRVLFFHNTASVDRFRLKCRTTVDPCRVYGWILAVLRRGVKHVDLNISIAKFTLPAALFTSKTLVTLKLDMEFGLDVPKGVHFPNLESLHLKSVEFLNDESVKSLFSSCNSLENMVIENCNMEHISNFNISHHSVKRLTILCSFDSSKCWLTIDTPNLVYFKYNDNVVAGYSLKNIESIIKADIDFLIRGNKALQADAATAFFRAICIVRSLVLSPNSLKILLRCEPLPVFATLVELEIRCFYSLHWRTKDKGLETLLLRLPELKKLAFRQEVLSCLPERVPFCLLSKLEVVQISTSTDDKDFIEKAKYILKNGGALQKLIIRSEYIYKEQKFKMSEVLFASPKKSKQCCILIA